MSRVRVAGFGVSLDGFSAGARTEHDTIRWESEERISFSGFFIHGPSVPWPGKEGGSVGDIDDVFASQAMENFGAFILGRNMFGPVRGPWPDHSWRGWWGRQSAVSCVDIRPDSL